MVPVRQYKVTSGMEFDGPDKNCRFFVEVDHALGMQPQRCAWGPLLEPWRESGNPSQRQVMR